MRLLLDTHIWFWHLWGPKKLAQSFEGLLADKNNELFLSPISPWEVLMLAQKGRLGLAIDPVKWIRQALEIFPVKEVPLTTEVAIVSRELKLPHDDPADRFLAATALVYDLKILTADKTLKKARGVPTV